MEHHDIGEPASGSHAHRPRPPLFPLPAPPCRARAWVQVPEDSPALTARTLAHTTVDLEVHTQGASGWDGFGKEARADPGRRLGNFWAPGTPRMIGRGHWLQVRSSPWPHLLPAPGSGVWSEEADHSGQGPPFALNSKVRGSRGITLGNFCPPPLILFFLKIFLGKNVSHLHASWSEKWESSPWGQRNQDARSS